MGHRAYSVAEPAQERMFADNFVPHPVDILSRLSYVLSHLCVHLGHKIRS